MILIPFYSIYTGVHVRRHGCARMLADGGHRFTREPVRVLRRAGGRVRHVRLCVLRLPGQPDGTGARLCGRGHGRRRSGRQPRDGHRKRSVLRGRRRASGASHVEPRLLGHVGGAGRDRGPVPLVRQQRDATVEQRHRGRRPVGRRRRRRSGSPVGLLTAVRVVCVCVRNSFCVTFKYYLHCKLLKNV